MASEMVGTHLSQLVNPEQLPDMLPHVADALEHAAVHGTDLKRGMKAAGLDPAFYLFRERGKDEVLPWDHIDSGLDKEWLWQDWLDAIDEVEVDDCRWTPCFDCGVCPQLGTEIQVGPTGKTLLPITVVGGSPVREQTHSHA